MDFLDRGWMCINLGIGKGTGRTHAGVVILLCKNVFEQSHVRFNSVQEECLCAGAV